ncbi:MAG: polyphosphate:AMP phosphotransferase [Rhodospirillaceae bacterium]|nr:polyphosphate:AMP phosphotransferase [Rhodospirillaceae bacterium]|tara:strand:+ start:841 stop:2325 length:1485 start_codon:yes stop_codon:yes gene_type:complete
MTSLFERVENNAKMPKAAFNEIASELRLRMVQMQQSLRHADFPVIVVFAGVDGAGKSESVQLLNEWMDPRWIVTRAYGKPSEEEAERPEFWRYWRDLPAKGQFGLYLSAWYSDPLIDKVYKRIGQKKLDARLAHISKFEQTLADDGALILKFWMHLNKKEQRKWLRKLENDPHQHWRITAHDWKNWKRYDRFIETAEHIIEQTDCTGAPWRLVDAADPPFRAYTVLTTIEQAVTERIAADKRKRKPRRIRKRSKPLDSSVLTRLDLSQTVSRADYGPRLKEQRARLHSLYRRAKAQDLSVILAFEGWDAAGKGGAIRRLTAALDARDYQVVPIAAPTDEERAHHYLWRFWRRVSRAGRFTIFDRSWYGRLLVEKVEQLIDAATYERSFDEIVEFEDQISEHGILLLKFWLHIDKDEQAARFEKRKATPYKRWKLTDEDWRNREKWDEYERCVDEMVRRTSTENSPWTLVEANDKRHARLKVIETLCERLEERLK